LAEQGRSVLWTQILRLRTEPERLTAVRPDLARRLGEIRDLLDRPGTWSFARRVPAGRTVIAGALDERRRLAREWDKVVAEVRALDGFEHFAAAVPFDHLRSAVDGGPVVVVGAGERGGYAVVLGAASTAVRLVSLYGLTHEVAERRAGQFLTLVRDAPVEEAVGGGPADGVGTPALDPEAVRQGLGEVLGWLWTAAAEPILRAIGILSPVDRPDRPGSEEPDGPQGLQRVWWCPIGPLALLPLHAAGLYEAGAPAGSAVADMVISSYTPTISALLRARRHRPPAPSSHLMVCLPQTPGLPPLPAARREADAVARRLPPSCRQTRLSRSEATAAAVRTHLPECSWVHLACHAHPDPEHPGNTAFLLWDWARQPLTVADLVGVTPADPDLAFLSACGTSATPPTLADESVTLAATMQVIGFRHVIATLWPGNDVVGARLAELVYAGMSDGERLDGDRAAAALHAAVATVRRRHPRDPALWATWVHFGP
jgi:hypothetical protein